MRRIFASLFIAVTLSLWSLSTSPAPALALTPDEDDVLVRVADIGAGLCCVIRTPGNHYAIYDAGRWAGDSQNHAIATVQSIIPPGSDIDLMVLSHSDADHLGAVPEICHAYNVRKVLRTGFERDTGTWRDAHAAIRNEVVNHGCTDIRLTEYAFPRGAVIPIGDAFIQFIGGWKESPAEWGLGGRHESEHRNAVSIVVKLTYRGKSVLFGGDSVGRHIGDANHVCIAAEKAMCDWNEVIPLKSDVIIAPHHGADNGSSMRFIRMVAPTHVIFSAGHQFNHPRSATAFRYMAQGVPLENFFRTDLGDHEGSAAEWGYGTLGNGSNDPVGDDDVDILLTGDGGVRVAYWRDGG